MVKPAINSEKHLVQRALNTVTGSTVGTATLIEAVRDPAGLNEVRVGAVVKAVFVELWVISDGMQLGSFNISLERMPGTAPNATLSDITSMNSYANKKNILYTTQGVLGDTNSNPIPAMRGWFKIPKGKQRFGLGDKLNLNITSLTADGMENCGIFIYKEYF